MIEHLYKFLGASNIEFSKNQLFIIS